VQKLLHKCYIIVFILLIMASTCRYCGLKMYQEKGRKDKLTCGVTCRVTLHRIKKKGYLYCMNERSEKDLEKRIRTIDADIRGLDEKDLLIHIKEHGDTISKFCAYIFLKGLTLKKYQKVYGFPKEWFM